MEGVLGEAMFAAPGSGVRWVVVGKRAGEGREGVAWFWRGRGGRDGGVLEGGGGGVGTGA